MADAPKSHTAYPSDVYETFDAFMQQVIKETYDHGAKRAEFVALVIASGELLPMAWGRMKKSGVRSSRSGRPASSRCASASSTSSADRSA